MFNIPTIEDGFAPWSGQDVQPDMAMAQAPGTAPGADYSPPQPQPFVQPYSDDEQINPRQLMWAGILSDIGGYLGSGGMRPMGNTGMQMYMQGQQYNNSMRTANQRAQQQHRADQLQYAQYQRGLESDRLARERAKAAADAAILGSEQYDRTEGRLQASSDERERMARQTHDLNERKFSAELEQIEAAAQESLDAGVPLEIVKTELDIGKDFSSEAKPFRETLSKVLQARELLSQNTGAAEVLGVVSTMQAADPSSIVSTAEQSMLSQAAGVLETIKGKVEGAQGEGAISGNVIEELKGALDTYAEVAGRNYDRIYTEKRAQLEAYGGTVDPGRAMPSNYYQDTYKPALTARKDQQEAGKAALEARAYELLNHGAGLTTDQTMPNGAPPLLASPGVPGVPAQQPQVDPVVIDELNTFFGVQ